MRKSIISIILAVSLLFSCKTKTTSNDQGETNQGRVPVTITHAVTDDISEVVEINATSTFLLKTLLKAPVAGYLREVNAQTGDKSGKGKKLFLIQTKEAASLGNTIQTPDSSLKFNGNIPVMSSSTGYLTKINYQVGDYVQDGETLAEISDISSLVFILNLPYELHQFISLNKNIRLVLPDGEQITGTISRALPSIDMVSQTQQFVVSVSLKKFIPENLIAKVDFVKNIHKKAIILPKEAVLTNESQSQFWIMRMIDSDRAVKVPVTLGIISNDKVEIINPKILSSESILLTGNYGLPDTAMVTVSKVE